MQDFKGLPINQYRYRPFVDSSYFHMLGMRLFIVPAELTESDTNRFHIRINFIGDDNFGVFHSSFGKDNMQNAVLSREELYGSFFVGGDYRRYESIEGTDTLYFVTRGDWIPFSDEDILGILKDVYKAQNDFWQDPRKGAFSVSLTPTFESWYSVGGSGFSTSFMSFSSNNDQVTLKHMKWLYNHEFLHKWIGRTIINENEVEQYWFSEGFTDYYAYKLQLKYKTLNVNEYIDILNSEVIIPHHKDPVRNIRNEDLTFETYWMNYATYMKLPYRRGLLYAFLLDIQIKEESNYTQSLDNLMLDLFQMALNDEGFRFNQDVFLNIIGKYLTHPKVVTDYERYILEGELIDFNGRLPEGLSIKEKDQIPVLCFDEDDSSDLAEKLLF
jgi:predicted metalloprotease with PDZ domain